MNQFFRHDYYAREDEKIEDLIDDHGVAGYGAFWIIVEKMHEYGGVLPWKRITALANEYHIGDKMLDDIINKYGLFRIDGDRIVSDRIAENLKERKEVSKKMKNLVDARWDKHRNTTP